MVGSGVSGFVLVVCLIGLFAEYALVCRLVWCSLGSVPVWWLLDGCATIGFVVLIVVVGDASRFRMWFV